MLSLILLLTDDVKTLIFWEVREAIYPCLKPIAEDTLAATASQAFVALVERIFSVCGLLRSGVRNRRVLFKFYFRLEISTSGFNFCKLSYWFVAICANLDFAICTNFQLHYNTNNNNEIKYCTTILSKTNSQKRGM